MSGVFLTDKYAVFIKLTDNSYLVDLNCDLLGSCQVCGIKVILPVLGSADSNALFRCIVIIPEAGAVILTAEDSGLSE